MKKCISEDMARNVNEDDFNVQKCIVISTMQDSQWQTNINQYIR